MGAKWEMWHRVNFRLNTLLVVCGMSIVFVVVVLAAGMAQELSWAGADTNSNLFVLFGKLAELQHLHAAAERKLAEKVRR